MPAVITIYTPKTIQRSIGPVYAYNLYVRLTNWLQFLLIFLKFCINSLGSRTDEAKFSKKILTLKKSKNTSKIGFFGFCQKLYPLITLFYPKMVHNSVLHVPEKAARLGKIWFFSYGLKCSQWIRVQYSIVWSSISLAEISWSLRFFAWR